jgi:hypothetical protein
MHFNAILLTIFIAFHHPITFLSPCAISKNVNLAEKIAVSSRFSFSGDFNYLSKEDIFVA